MAFTASTPGQGALPLHRHSQLQAGVGGRNAEAGAMEAAGRDSFSAFYLFPQPSGKATPDNGRQRAHGRELSPSGSGCHQAGAANAGWPAAQGDAGSSQEHPLRLVSRHNLARLNVKAFITFIQTKSMHVKTCKYGHKHPILFALLNFCP